ncbi:c-type heme family protein [Calothrix sp. NIES-2098]|uniref:c-type heme family protein n=1 Tax=Calothrix sp. NIES-2098 TaxID=1954171 RepID=UPI000B612E64|nr:putative sensor with HAMP domain protein [Calothrix sp. NIES-2098]
MLKKIKDFKIGTKFNLLLIVVFIISIVISGTAFSTVLQRRAQTEVAEKAQILIKTMNSVRKYTQDNVNPRLAPELETEPVFIPETVPAFSATEVFENLRKNDEYKNYLYKEATLNPTNLRDKADGFETQIVERFRNNSKLQEIADFRDVPEGKVFYIARPLAITQEKCLRCHSTPEQAPKSQLTTYGSNNGFGWKLNEVVAAQIISVPSEEVFNSAQQTWILIMGLLIAIFAVVVILINFLIKKTVIERIKRIEKIAQQVSTGDMEANFHDDHKDEIGGLAAAFNRMKYSLRIAMDMLNQQGQ